MDFADLVAKVEPREKVVAIITGGDLLGEHERATEELSLAMRQTRTSMADGSPVGALAAKVADLEKQIAASTVEIRLRGIGRNAFRALLDTHPGEDGRAYDFDTFPPALISACAVDPTLTEAQAYALADVLTDGQWDEIFDAAWTACREVPDGVPFSGLASAAMTD